VHSCLSVGVSVGVGYACRSVRGPRQVAFFFFFGVAAKNEHYVTRSTNIVAEDKLTSSGCCGLAHPWCRLHEHVHLQLHVLALVQLQVQVQVHVTV